MNVKRAAKILGRLGGKKGGPARAKKLSKKRRRAIAIKAAKARWANKPPESIEPSQPGNGPQ